MGWEKIISKLFGARVECSVESCREWTRSPHQQDPAYRWIVGVILTDEDGTAHTVNLCPQHIQEFFPRVTKDWFESLQNAEAMIRAHMGKRPPVKELQTINPTIFPRAASPSPSESKDSGGLAATSERLQ